MSASKNETNLPRLCKRYSSVLVLAALAVVFSGCSTFSKSREQNLYQVHVGESKTELVKALGEPEKRLTLGAHEKWFYEVYAADNREVYPYTATFENEALVKWEFDTARHAEASHGYSTIREPASTERPFSY